MKCLVALERELGEWVESELEFYVKDYISDSDYRTLLNNLIDIAKAHAANVRARKP